MSKLGDIQNSYGKTFAIAVANASVKTIMDAATLPNNTLIISAQQNNEGVDTDTSCLIITDNEGTPVRLTYQFIPGNGIVVDNNYIYIGIDNKTIFEDTNGRLSVNCSKFVDDKTIKVNTNKKLYIDINNLGIATENSLGLVKIDGETVNINMDGQLYVNTNNLLHASYDTAGIARGDNTTIITNDGTLSVNTENLAKATKDIPGIIKPDNDTIIINESSLHIVTANLQHATETQFGIGTGDGKTIITKDGVINVNEAGLAKCNNTLTGVVKLDNNTLKIDNNIASLANPNLYTDNYYTDLLKELDNIYNRVVEMSRVDTKGQTILSVSFNSTSATSLPATDKHKSLLNIPKNDVYIFMTVKTISNFTVNISFVNNVAPMCEINEIVFNNKTECTGNVQEHVFQSTNGEEQRLVIHITCYNYKSATLANKLVTSVQINIADALNVNNNKNTVYSIVRYNLTPNKVDTGINEIENTIYIYEPNMYGSYWTKNLSDLSTRSKLRLKLAKEALQHIKK